MKMIIENYSSPRGIGTPKFEDAMKMMNELVEPIKLREGIRVLDYGCGDGRVSNYLSSKLEDFT